MSVQFVLGLENAYFVNNFMKLHSFECPSLEVDEDEMKLKTIGMCIFIELQLFGSLGFKDDRFS